MSLVLPPLYHWSPEKSHAGITKHGLKPLCHTAIPPMGPAMFGGAREIDTERYAKAVCLGTSPSHAWGLSGKLFADKGTHWDLWQVTLAAEDEVYPMAFHGNRMSEFRVLNLIPKSRVWYVARRTA